MDDLEYKLHNLQLFNIDDIHTSLHRVLNNFDIRFDIDKFISLMDTILNINITDDNWDKTHELFDTALLGCISYISDNDIFWAKWVYNKLVWRKIIKRYIDIDYINLIENIGKINHTVKALYTLRLIFAKNVYSNENDIVKERCAIQNAFIELNNTIEFWINDILIEPLFYNPIFSKVAAYNVTYHNYSNTLILQQQGLLYQRMLQKLYQNHGGLNKLQNKCENTRKKIGFVSYHLYNHSVGKVSIGLIEQLYKRNLFEIHIFSNNFCNNNDPYNTILRKSCHKFHGFYKEGQLEWIKKIQEENIDILIFLDPIMDITRYILACFRIVPIQIATSGHPDTSGLASIDYYVSSSVFEKNGTNNYVEKLVLFDSLNMYYYNPEKFLNYSIQDMLRACNKKDLRAMFNFPDCNIYAITCPAIKISPQFEIMISKILLNDKNGVIIMTEDANSFYFKNMIERFNRTIPADICDRIFTVPFITNQDLFYKYIYCADVVLDPFPFGGLISTIDIFTCGRVVITLPGEKLYGRFTSGIYKYNWKMIESYLVAENMDDYVKKAIQLAKDKVLRATIENAILESLPNIFEDTKTIDDWCNFLNSAL